MSRVTDEELERLAEIGDKHGGGVLLSRKNAALVFGELKDRRAADLKPEDVEALRRVAEAAKDVRKHITMPTNGDWACAECRPHSDMLHICPGWQCAQHRFLAALAALEGDK